MVLGAVVVEGAVRVLGLGGGFGAGARLFQIVVASGRRTDGSVVIGSVPRRKKMERGGLVKSDGVGDVIGVEWCWMVGNVLVIVWVVPYDRRLSHLGWFAGSSG